MAELKLDYFGIQDAVAATVTALFGPAKRDDVKLGDGFTGPGEVREVFESSSCQNFGLSNTMKPHSHVHHVLPRRPFDNKTNAKN